MFANCTRRNSLSFVSFIPILFLSLFRIAELPAQDISDFLEAQLPVPFQKLFLHIDRTLYFSQDTLWFAAYLLDAQTHRPAQQVCNLYVDIVSAEGNVMEHETFIIQNGYGAGQLILGRNLPEGNLLLRAYTDYMRNFPVSSFFSQPITINRNGNRDELNDSEESAVRSPKIDLMFMPEGGFLLAEATNAVSFKAIDEKGLGVQVSGKILDDAGEEVQKFSSTFKGAGKFYFYHAAGESFYAQLDGYEQRFQLPEARTSGVKIKLVRLGTEHVDLVIQEKNMASDEVFFLAVLHRGSGLFFVQIDRSNRNSLLKFPFSNLEDGINRFVLLDKDLKPLSERLIFKRPKNLVNFSITMNKGKYANRDEVIVELDGAVDSSELATVSLSVVDKSYLIENGTKFDMVAYLLLDAELRGHIESPADYFEEGEVTSVIKLDLLMTTQGWSNYLWPSLRAESVKLSFEPRLGFDFYGSVARNFSRKALFGASVSLIIYEDEGKTRFFDQPLNKKGDFEFKNTIFADSASVVAQARSKNNHNNLQFDLKLPEVMHPEVTKESLRLLNTDNTISSSLFAQRQYHETLLNAYDPSFNTIYLEGVEVRGQKIEKVGKTGSVQKNDGPYRLDPKHTMGVTNIIEYLQFKVSGVTQSSSGGISLIGGGSDPLIYIDGGPRLTADEARGYSVEIFETIEIVTPPASYFYRAPEGAVLLTTKSGATMDKANVPLLGGMVDRIKGFSSYRTFYSPTYTPQNVAEQIPDLRYTLYWNPQFTFKAKSTLPSFFTSDLDGQYQILVHGITEQGKICTGMAEFEVGTAQH